MMKKCIAILVLAAAAVSCTTVDTREAEQVKETVKRYNAQLAQGYATMNMAGLAQVAEDSQTSKVYFHMAALGEGRIRMMSELKDISFRDIRFAAATSASVKTREVWDFRHVNIDTGKVERDEKGFVYQINYHLAKKNGAWWVRDVAAEGEEGKGGVNKTAPAAPVSGKGRAQ